MMDRILELIVDESKWLTVSLTLALVAVVALLRRHRRLATPGMNSAWSAMTLSFAVTISVMAFGHLVAVITKHALGALQVTPWRVYGVGVLLALPSWALLWSMRHAFRRPAMESGAVQGSLAATVLSLMVLGLHNLPLAAPGMLALVFPRCATRVLRGAVVGLSIAITAALFVGSIVFWISGQSFEQFSGME